ncbi:MAG: hypothetical protein LQ345_002167 [Seirophora villosa]|nr:MAG: hypothetical protein LQ345_002167 [Seirophora villosa]
MPLPSGKASRELLDELDEDLHEHQSDWERTVKDVKKVLQKYKLSEEPEDLQALIAYESDIHKYTDELQEYFMARMDIQQQTESVAIEGFTVTKRAAERIRRQAEARSAHVERVKDILRQMLVKCPLASLALDQDHVFGKEFHEATNAQIRELTAKVDQMCAKMIRDVDQIHAQLRAELKIENLEERFQGYCALAELKVTQAMEERQRLQEENNQLKASKSKTKRSLNAERQKTDALTKQLADAEARLAGAEARLAGAEDGKGKELALHEKLNEARDRTINMMQESLDKNYESIQHLNSDVRSLKAAHEESEARATAAIDERDIRIRDLDIAAAEHQAAQTLSQATIARQARELQHATATTNSRNITIRDLESAAAEHKVAQGQSDATIARQARELQHATATIDARDTRIRILDGAADERETELFHSEATNARQAEQLQSANATINRRDITIRDLKSAATEHEVAQGQFQTMIARQAEQLQSATTATNARDITIRDLEVAADERDRKFKSLEAKLSASELANGEKNEEIQGLEEQVQSLQKARDTAVDDAQERSTEIRHLESAAKERDDTVQSLNDQLSALRLSMDAKDRETADLQAIVETKDGQLADLRASMEANLQATVTDKDGQLSALGDSIDAKDRELADLQATVSNKDGQLSALGDSIDAKDQELADLQATVSNKDGQLSALGQSIDARDRELADLQATVSNKDGQLSTLRASIDANDKETANLRETVKAKDEQLTESQASLKAKDEELAHLRATIENKDQEMATIQSTVEDKVQAMATLRSTVDNLKQTLQTADDETATRRQLLLENTREIATLKSEVATRRQQLLENGHEIEELKSEASSMRQRHRGEVTAKKAEITKRERTLRSAIGMMVTVLSDSTSIERDEFIVPRLEQMFLHTSDVDRTIPVNHVALPSLCVSVVAQISSTSHLLCLFMAVYCGRNYGEINFYAQGVLDAAQQLGHMKNWIKVIVLQMIQRLQGEEDNGQSRILWIIAMQFILLLSSLMPGDGWLVDAANQINAAVHQTSSPALHFMMGQLLSSLANAQTTGNFAWLSGYHAGADQLDDSNSALPQGTRLIGEAPDLFFFASTGGLTVFSADDVKTVSWDINRAKGWELKLIFKESTSVRLDPITLSMNAATGPAFAWAARFLLSKGCVSRSPDP